MLYDKLADITTLVTGPSGTGKDLAARAIAMAELEIAGDYREERHDVFFDEYGADGLAPEDMALFADYLVCINASSMDAREQAALMELLSSGLPVKRYSPPTASSSPDADRARTISTA